MFREQPEEFYTDGFEKFVQRRRCWIELEGRYMESEIPKQGTHSELYFMFCFISMFNLDVKIQI
jgi:hypothetical protein